MKKVTVLRRDLYYEAIIQLRPATEELLNFVERQVAKRKDVWISKIVEHKTGIDLYISSRKFARALGMKLKRSFKGELKITKSLYGVDRQTSKRIWRVTVLFRLRKD